MPEKGCISFLGAIYIRIINHKIRRYDTKKNKIVEINF